ncbi:MAG TPA: DUF1801 domain-containing protein [Thermoanaerobaculia bacterium]|nr:DUF1801 domain-containing protein [Thermoanaerobaculia bacterium]
MVSSAAVTPEDYLSSLPDERRAVMSQMRDLIRKNLPKGYVESMNWGMLSYEIPLDRYPDTYNGQPLGYVALAAQKNAYSLYLLGPYGDERELQKLRDGFAKAGKKLDMGKSCVRFKKPQDLALDALAEAIASTPPEAYIAQYEAVRSNTGPASTTVKKKAARKA